MEHIYRKYYGNGKGLIDAKVGYCGGNSSDPSYKLVCTGSTGRMSTVFIDLDKSIDIRIAIDAEALQISFDPSKVTYETLVDFFFRIHDPTTMNRQGPDRGSQYRSAIFYHSPEQKRISEDVKARMQKSFYTSSPIVTQILSIDHFWDAEAYHQLYLVTNPYGCVIAVFNYISSNLIFIATNVLLTIFVRILLEYLVAQLV